MPTIIDIVVAVVFFSAAFNAWFGLIVFVTMALYLRKLLISLHINIQYIYRRKHLMQAARQLSFHNNHFQVDKKIYS